MNKKQRTFKLSDETFVTLEKQAKENCRSQAGQLEYLILQEEKRSDIK